MVSPVGDHAMARLRSLASHTIFGVGLYAAALVSAVLFGQ